MIGCRATKTELIAHVARCDDIMSCLPFMSPGTTFFLSPNTRGYIELLNLGNGDTDETQAAFGIWLAWPSWVNRAENTILLHQRFGGIRHGITTHVNLQVSSCQHAPSFRSNDFRGIHGQTRKTPSSGSGGGALPRN